MPLPHEAHTRVQNWIFHQNKAARKLQELLQPGREARVKRVTWKHKPAQYSLGDYVLIHGNRLQSSPVPEGGARDTLWYGPHLVVGTTGSGIVARCSPSLGGEVPVAHKCLKHYPFEFGDLKILLRRILRWTRAKTQMRLRRWKTTLTSGKMKLTYPFTTGVG